MKIPHTDAICTVCTSGVSVVCMSSMAAALGAAGAAVGASVTGMGGMAATSSGTSSPTSALPGLFDWLGLGVLNTLPNEVLQPVLVVLLTLNVAAAYVAYRGHRKPHALALTLAAGLVAYAAIYVWMSDALYFLGLAGLLAAAAAGIYLSRAPAVAAASGPAG